MTADTGSPAAELARLQAEGTATEAFALYDALPAARVPDILGDWRGEGLDTGHPMDGLLELYGWHGKRFASADDVQPLVFDGPRGPYPVNPAAMPLGASMRLPRALLTATAPLARRGLRLVRTSKPRARLRMMEHRGVVTATMSYDALPINDHFRRVDDATLLGVMDLRDVPPFFFVLRR